MSEQPEARTYRFPLLDRSGWLLGLTGAQCLILGVGVIAAGILLQRRLPAPAILAPIILTVVLAFGGWEGRPAHERIPAVGRLGLLRLTRTAHWQCALPLISGTADSDLQADLPPFLDGLSIIDAGPVAWNPDSAVGGVAILHDSRLRTVSASLRVRARGFALLEPADRDQVVSRWAEVIAAFCAERSPVVGVRVTEWAGPAGLTVFEPPAADSPLSAGAAALDAYCELLADAAPATSRHEVLVTVTVPASRRPPTGATEGTSPDPVGVLLDQLRLLATRLDSADLVVEGALSPAGVAETLRLRCDPSVQVAANRRGVWSLAAMAGVVSRYNAGPLATAVDWDRLRIDGALHRTYWVAEWPRLDVPAGWLEPLLLHPGGTRTFALHCEPVPPSRSRRGVDRDATRLAADGEQRSRAGFRLGARHRRAEAAVMEREAELVAGHGELAYAGFLTVTAPTQDELDQACADYEQAAASAGLELRALHGRHDLAFVCGLPVGRGLAPRRCA